MLNTYMDLDKKVWYKDVPDSTRIEIEDNIARKEDQIENNEPSILTVLSFQGILAFFKWFKRKRKGN